MIYDLTVEEIMKAKKVPSGTEILNLILNYYVTFPRKWCLISIGDEVILD